MVTMDETFPDVCLNEVIKHWSLTPKTTLRWNEQIIELQIVDQTSIHHPLHGFTKAAGQSYGTVVGRHSRISMNCVLFSFFLHFWSYLWMMCLCVSKSDDQKLWKRCSLSASVKFFMHLYSYIYIWQALRHRTVSCSVTGTSWHCSPNDLGPTFAYGLGFFGMKKKELSQSWLCLEKRASPESTSVSLSWLLPAECVCIKQIQ